MAKIQLAAGVFEDLDRILDHLEHFGVPEANQPRSELIDAINILAHSSHIGRPVRGGKRERGIGTGARGYIALYRVIPPLDTVIVLAIRSHRERGYRVTPG